MIRISTREAQRAQVYLTQPNVQPIPEPIPMASAGGDTTILGQGVWEVLTKGVGGHSRKNGRGLRPHGGRRQ